MLETPPPRVPYLMDSRYIMYQDPAKSFKAFALSKFHFHRKSLAAEKSQLINIEAVLTPIQFTRRLFGE